jgi:hypothetical protein
MRSRVFESVDVVEFHTVEEYSSFGLTRFKYNNNILSIEEKEQVIGLITSSISTDCRKR